MQATIYWFSGTGNSLAVARDLHSMLPSTLRSIRNGPHPDDSAGLECLVLVFPVYHATFGKSGIPGPVLDFIGRHPEVSKSTVYGIATHDGFPGSTLHNLDRILRCGGGRLSAGIAIRAGVPFAAREKIRYAMGRSKLIVDEQRDHMRRNKLRSQWQAKLRPNAEMIAERGRGPIEGTTPLGAVLIKPWLALQRLMAQVRYRELAHADKRETHDFHDLVMQSDRSFEVSDSCTGCGTCARVCPVFNITMTNKRPVWTGRCENCAACFQWCPERAISGGVVEYAKRWRWPDITARDFYGSTS